MIDFYMCHKLVIVCKRNFAQTAIVSGLTGLVLITNAELRFESFCRHYSGVKWNDFRGFKQVIPKVSLGKTWELVTAYIMFIRVDAVSFIINWPARQIRLSVFIFREYRNYLSGIKRFLVRTNQFK